MGRDLTLYPEHASKEQLCSYLLSLGFKRCQHLWDWPKGTVNYSWFERKDFKSIDGVSADVYPLSDTTESLKVKWALHVRNLQVASWHDVSMLNTVLRGARARFGGTIRGDYGTNRYAPLWQDKSTPLSRGISAVYSHVKQEIRLVRHALPQPIINLPSPTDTLNSRVTDLVATLDPSRVIYNGLVPFVVAIFEYFFSHSFQVLLAYDEHALAKRGQHKAKIDFSSVLEVDRRDRTLEEVISEGYTFQNLDQLNRAFKDWLDIDVRKLLFRKRRIGRSIQFLESRIAEIIQYRHGIVHHLAIDTNLTRDGLLAILEAVEKAIDEFVLVVRKRYSIKIDDFM